MKLSKRTIGLVLALTAVAAVLTGRARPVPETQDSRGARAETAAIMPVIDLSKLARAQPAAPQADPFAARSFAPAVASQPQAEAKAAAPSAPPLPFRYFGRLTENGRTEVFVLRGDELISVAAGKAIDPEYRVDQVSETRIAFTFLPLKKRQSLELEEDGG